MAVYDAYCVRDDADGPVLIYRIKGTVARTIKLVTRHPRSLWPIAWMSPDKQEMVPHSIHSWQINDKWIPLYE